MYDGNKVSVGDIRELIKDMPDEAEVTIFIPENLKDYNNRYKDYMRFAAKIAHVKPSGINNRELEITAGDFFSY